MALYKVDVEKLYNNEYWTNVYHIDAVSMVDAGIQMDAIVAFEASIHFVPVTITKARVSTVTPNDNQYITKVYNTPGTRDATGNDFLPLFNVIRVDITDSGFGRPERKYFKLPVSEQMQNDGTLNNTIISEITAAFNALIANDDVALTGPNGESLVSATTFPKVGMRQLRRGSKRRLQPILP